MRLLFRSPAIRNRIYLTVEANLDGINLTRLRGLVRADGQMRILTAAGTVMLVVGIGFVAAAVHTLISGSGDGGVAVFQLLWGMFVSIMWVLWMHRLVTAAASLRGLLQRAFTTVTFPAA